MKKKSPFKVIILFIAIVTGLLALAIMLNLTIEYYTTIPDECNMDDETAKYGPIKKGTQVVLGGHRPVNKMGQWVVVMSKWREDDNTTQSYIVSDEFPVEYIEEKEKGGYFIYLIEYANNEWIVVMNKIQDFSQEQVWEIDNEYPEDFIDNHWDGYFVTDIEYGGGTWAIVMSEDASDYRGQSYSTDETFPQDFIVGREEKGYFVTDIEYGDGYWVTLTTKWDDFIGNQEWIQSSNFPRKFIYSKEHDGYIIFDIETNGGKWAVLMRREPGYLDQRWYLDDTLHKDTIKNRWDENYYITSISYGSVGSESWAYEKNTYVGVTATVTELAGTDAAGCPVVKVNVDEGAWLWRIRDLTLASKDSSTSELLLSEYLYDNAPASTGQNTTITLSDGAEITVFATSINEDVEVTIERNPSKINNLPPLGNDVIPLSDFYNFEITDGMLIGPVEIKLPFDNKLIPNESGILTIAIPTDDGWEFTPVSSYDGYVTFQTTNLGDPLIAWHFGGTYRVNLEYELSGKNYHYCEWIIPVTMTPSEGDWTTNYTLSGRVIPNSEYDSDVSNIGLVIKANYWEDPAGGTFYTVTDEDGRFEVEINPLENEFFTFQKGLNGFHVLAECDSPQKRFSSTSQGWITFKIQGNKPDPSSSDSSTSSSTDTSTTQSPMLYLDKNYFCRIGPNSGFPDVTSFYAGTSLPIIGKTNTGWWLVSINESHTTRKSCWIGGGVVSGDTSNVTYYEPPSVSRGNVSLYNQQGGYVRSYRCDLAQSYGEAVGNGWYLIRGVILGGNYPDLYFSYSEYKANCPEYPDP